MSGSTSVLFIMTVYIAKISLHVLDEDISENDIRLFEKMVTNVGRTSYLKLDKMQNQKNERYYSYMEGKRQ